MSKRFSGWAWIVAVIWSLGLNYANLHVYRSTCNEPNCQSVPYIIGADDYWYQIPAYNLIRHGELNYLIGDKQLAVRRTPIYPLLIASQLGLWENEYVAFTVLVHLQLLLMALGAVLLGRAAWHLTQNVPIGQVVTWLAVFFPVWHLQVFHTMTEAVYPALVCLIIYAFAKAVRLRSKTRWFWLGMTGMLLGIGSLTRPLVILVGAGLGTYLLFEAQVALRQKLLHVTILTSAFLLCMSPWVIRNYRITGELVLLEKYYDNSPTEWGAALKGLQRFEAVFQNPNIEAGYVGKLFAIERRYHGQMQQNYSSDSLAISYVQQLPLNVRSIINQDSLLITLKTYNTFFIELIKQAKLIQNKDKFSFNVAMFKLNQVDSIKSLQASFYKSFLNHCLKLQSELPMMAWIITPIKRLSLLIFHSFSTCSLLASPIESTIAKYLRISVKVVLFLGISSVFFSVIILLIVKLSALSLLVGIPVLITAFYLCWISGYVEVRYMLQTYPLMMLSLGVGLIRGWDKIRRRLGRQD